ncbi:hypothetical protein PR202_gb00351 [Eleusine coracana subsp. coracana]|uniref:Uncharacterized protein n=1 Tax=Eleusine coracana subsp. coracana TaxID=191504 RepID=A0AAV5DTY6_ELECO|nr:hypothetical protein PR202_gb00351 [Eleusine coracana subsp. coracana]
MDSGSGFAGAASSPSTTNFGTANGGNGFAMSEQRLRKTPLWRHVKVLQAHGALGGNAKSQCLYYGSIIPGSYSRVKAHLFREPGEGTCICGAATLEMVMQFHAEEAAAKSSANCKAAGLIVDAKYNNIFWTPYVVHTLNLALKNICAARIEDGNTELQFISDAAVDALQIKNYSMNHGMRLSMFNEFSKLKFLAIADTRFAYVIVMLKRFLLLKDSLVWMVISDKWTAYRKDDQQKAQFVREKLLDEDWWYQVKYIAEFTEPIYSMLRAVDTDKPCLHLIFEMCDNMIEKVKSIIFSREGLRPHDTVADARFSYWVYRIIRQWQLSSAKIYFEVY